MTRAAHLKMMTMTRLSARDDARAEPGDEHVAYPQGPARILVVERKDSE
ncbi:hypothetical protein [Novosphingobium profundi]|nr:hypothetical protein [Novosphingobium profundi]